MIAVRNHDRDALHEVLSPLRDYLLLIANEDLNSDLRAKLGASDVVQQTLALACQRMDQFRGSTPDELKAWLRQILHNCLHDWERHYLVGQRRSIHRERAGIDWRNQPPSIPDPSATPGTDAIAQEEARLLEQAMATLPDHVRRVLHLRNWEEKSFSEIGQVMGISDEAARKVWYRGIVKLEAILKLTLKAMDGSPAVTSHQTPKP